MAETALSRRAAAVALAGVPMGQLPLLWLIHEALDDSVRRYATATRQLRLLPATRLRNELWLVVATFHVVEERDTSGACIRTHEVPAAALLLHDAVKASPIAAEALLRKIERG